MYQESKYVQNYFCFILLVKYVQVCGLYVLRCYVYLINVKICFVVVINFLNELIYFYKVYMESFYYDDYYDINVLCFLIKSIIIYYIDSDVYIIVNF